MKYPVFFIDGVPNHSGIYSTGEKAIGTGWTVAPPEEEESNWGGTTLTM